MDNNRTYYSHEAEVRAARKNAALVVLALSVGAGIGAVAGLMLAPNTGQKTRKDLANSLEQGVKNLEEKVEEARKA
jgi:gas vesicle protein